MKYVVKKHQTLKIYDNEGGYPVQTIVSLDGDKFKMGEEEFSLCEESAKMIISLMNYYLENTDRNN